MLQHPAPSLLLRKPPHRLQQAKAHQPAVGLEPVPSSLWASVSSPVTEMESNFRGPFLQGRFLDHMTPQAPRLALEFRQSHGVHVSFEAHLFQEAPWLAEERSPYPFPTLLLRPEVQLLSRQH